MRWLKRDMWKAGVAFASVLLLVFMVWVPVSVADAYEGASGLAGPGTVRVQATPTEDATVTALNKAKLEQEIQQLKYQNDHSIAAWFWNSSGLLGPIVAALLAVAGVLWSAKVAQDKNLADSQAERTRRNEEQRRWLKDQEAEREKRAEERFQRAVEGLGSERTEAKIGAAIMLHTFLGPDYKRFYRQAFELAVAYLQIRRADPNTPTPIDSLSRALITVFKESFPKTRDMLKQPFRDLLKQYPDFFDASRIHVDNGYFVLCDLKEIWMRDAYLRDADLSEADMSGADLCGACLDGAVLSKANLSRANLSGTNIEDAKYLNDTNLRGVKGLTKEQLEACKAKGAIIDEDATAS